MKNKRFNPYLKSFFIICALVASCLLFRYIGNKDIKTVIGLGGFFLIAYSWFRRNNAAIKKQG